MEDKVTKKKILILNAGYSEIPLIDAAKEEGFYVITTGMNGKAPGHKLADEYVPADYSDGDAIYDLAKEKEVNAICSGCTDFSYLATAYACEKLGLPGHDSYEVAKILHHKDMYRKFAQRVGIKSPKAITYTSKSDLDKLSNLSFPVLVKPVDLFSGMGISRCESAREVETAIKKVEEVTREPKVVIEEFLEGTNHGFSVIIKDKKVICYIVDEEVHDYNEYAVSAAFTPSGVPQSALQQLICDTETMSRELNLVDGLVHIQFILSADGIPTILEVCRRSPGDLYIKFAQKATGVNYPKLIVRSESGLPIDVATQGLEAENWLRQVVACTQEGIVIGLEIDETIKKYIVESDVHLEEGHKIEKGQIYKCGVLFLKFNTAEEMREVAKNIKGKLRFTFIE